MNTAQTHKLQSSASVNCMVITVSDTRNQETDKSGQLMIRLLEEAGHAVTAYQIVQDDFEAIREIIVTAVSNAEIDIILLTGGTGISSRDTTYEPSFLAPWVCCSSDAAQ